MESPHSEFQALWRLIRSAEVAEVEARDGSGPPEEVSELMKRFAEGKLDSKDRNNLIEALTARPDWVSHLAREIKARRGDGDFTE